LFFGNDSPAPIKNSIFYNGLERFWSHNDRKKLLAEQIDKIDRILDLLDEIEELPKDLLSFPELAIHALKGDLAGFWSVKVTGTIGLSSVLTTRTYPRSTMLTIMN
jgi:proteic killer suppression protein